jgi:hypothetical protein
MQKPMLLDNVTHKFSEFVITKSEKFCSTVQQAADKISFFISFVFLFQTSSKIQTENFMYITWFFDGILPLHFYAKSSTNREVLKALNNTICHVYSSVKLHLFW